MDAEAESGNVAAAIRSAEAGRAEQAAVSNRAWESQWVVAIAILSAAELFSRPHIDLTRVPALHQHLAHALALRVHPIPLVLAGLAGLPDVVAQALRTYSPVDAPARHLRAAATAFAHGERLLGFNALQAAHHEGLHYTNMGNELLALGAEHVGRRAEALSHWSRLADKPSIIWREVAHNWPGLIRLARQRVALLSPHSP